MFCCRAPGTITVHRLVCRSVRSTFQGLIHISFFPSLPRLPAPQPRQSTSGRVMKSTRPISAPRGLHGLMLALCTLASQPCGAFVSFPVPCKSVGRGAHGAGVGLHAGAVDVLGEGAALAKFKRLQTQSDIRGVSMEGVPKDKVDLSTEEAYCIGVGFRLWLRRKVDSIDDPLRVSVGRDPRLSGEQLSQAIIGGMTSQEGGCIVADCGLCTTPAMFMSCVTEGHMYDGAIMITASHLPSHRNGFKFFTKSGGLNNQDIAETEFLPVYQQQLKDMIIDQVDMKGPARDRPLEGLKVVVNAGNGNGGFLAETLSELGADTGGSVHLEPDGTFPNHLANPELPQAMVPTIEAVQSVGADLGVVLDTDVDRSGVVDRSGEAINRNRLIAFLATVVLRDSPGTTIVTDSTTSNGLKKFIEARGGVHLRFKKGYKNVIDKAIELNEQGTDCQLAIETSGHAAFKENHMLDDGAYLALKVLVEMARQGKGVDLSGSIKDLAEVKRVWNGRRSACACCCQRQPDTAHVERVIRLSCLDRKVLEGERVECFLVVLAQG
ncbi:Phosphomannomutase/phosphoglucomutase [Ectocarpus siliculosus]|uniref:Phosphomannomutase/phosphoglucomutase n=1 Tax=Ectocarpus siliculosus TaxID=2880 RepID=D7FKV1_ECTSI|nr:Phosphomannomutase/phosphoglucomutase [Ectocarpus siliculosus]|eukprot:CBJ29496.1 Phosphomannomutase/phosphoglucomutase [Ectocarpus siliculosus]